MRVEFHPDAEAELVAAVDYYESSEPGLGFEFALEANLALERAVKYPTAWALLDANLRRTLFRRFPYGLIYSANAERLVVVAVMNLHRKPGYWRERTK
ncbi:plasmid stabilization protein [Cellvibrio sp. PSBB023]|uniref:plasmid stabilization protein n=1 Tax=Cellvibrio sp. PSBB023 TaxID=1945512 RepID=UPI00098F2523|nr:plasmid stabilization protein [Cellvibrio sp. PSBB023]AQT60815.1 plasmid stabilization protein [Cellvibrio sp. PSBB023]